MSGNCTATRFNGGLNDRQAQSTAAGVTGAGAIWTIKRFEEARELLGWHSRAIVRDGNCGPSCSFLAAEGDVRRGAGVDAGIAQQVPNGPAYQLRIAENG